MDVVHGYKRSASCVYIFIDVLQAIIENGKSMKYLSLFKRGLPSTEIYLIFFFKFEQWKCADFQGNMNDTKTDYFNAMNSWGILRYNSCGASLQDPNLIPSKFGFKKNFFCQEV